MKYILSLALIFYSTLAFGTTYSVGEELSLLDKDIDFLTDVGLEVGLGGLVCEEILEVKFTPNNSYLESRYDIIVFLVDAENNSGLSVSRFAHCEGCETRFYVEKGYGLVVVLHKYERRSRVSYRVTIDNFDGRANPNFSEFSCAN
ncbi:hypothetical protein [Marinimicrobium alkaliphilum]|uniref:hypothetical protein n=1 Tax=Marinimicrobium alkaliphilum TaxID=2202654 RepID=UPI000DB99D4F|nr:hypothetical protein [Marinimicrobium alkaliphilum]